MQKPDIRLANTLTLDILTSSSHWTVFDGDVAYTACTSAWSFSNEEHCGRVFRYLKFWKVHSMPLDSYCYPCHFNQYTGVITPHPWPIVEGEDVIESMNGYNQCSSAPDYYFDGEMCWIGIPDEDDGVFPIVPQRSGMHPAKRKGKDGIVWVWEANKET